MRKSAIFWLIHGHLIKWLTAQVHKTANFTSLKMPFYSHRFSLSPSQFASKYLQYLTKLLKRFILVSFSSTVRPVHINFSSRLVRFFFCGFFPRLSLSSTRTHKRDNDHRWTSNINSSNPSQFLLLHRRYWFFSSSPHSRRLKMHTTHRIRSPFTLISRVVLYVLMVLPIRLFFRLQLLLKSLRT